jgi:predicted RNA-binding protein with TRAM domain
MRDKFGGSAPINEGEEYDVKVEAVGEKGDGIVRIKGFVVFVPNVKEGDEVRIKVTKVLQKVGFGESIGASTKPIKEERKKEVKKEEPEEVFDTSKDSEDFGEDL